MSFTRAKPSGWATGEVLTSTQMNALDLDHSRAIDGFAGGDYSPSADVTFSAANSISWIGTSRYPKLSSRTLTRMQRVQMAKSDALASWVTTTAPLAWSQSTTSANTLVSWIDNLIDGATLTAVRVTVAGAGGHGALPATMPTLKVFRAVPTFAQLGSTATDGSGSVGVYEAGHNISVTGLSEVINQSTGQVYYIEVTSEGGANAVAGFKVFSCTAEFTTTLCTPGG